MQGATRLVLCVEVEQCDRNLIRRKPLGQGDHDAGFADSAFAAHGENNTLRNGRHCSPPLVVRVRGSFSRNTKRAGFAFRTAGFALRAATRSSTGESAVAKLHRRQFKLRSLAMLCADLHEGVEGAECDIHSQPLVEKASDFAVRAPFAAQFADQFAVGFQFGAWTAFQGEIREWFDVLVPYGLAPERFALIVPLSSPITRSDYA